MNKKTYTVLAHYKLKYYYTIYSESALSYDKIKQIALDNQADWERVDDVFNHGAPIIEEVIEK